ncbi:MAG: hypothetical protein E6J34_23780 [Chloroflexi bacterium]|nr:MAG: hypothetical protein E6J34_23780 [Chloroflexota bacterium]
MSPARSGCGRFGACGDAGVLLRAYVSSAELVLMLYGLDRATVVEPMMQEKRGSAYLVLKWTEPQGRARREGAWPATKTAPVWRSLQASGARL